MFLNIPLFLENVIENEQIIHENENYAVVLPGQLLFGNVKLAEDVEILKLLQIKAVVNLIDYKDGEEDMKPKYDSDINVLFKPVVDSPTNGIEWVNEAYNFIDNEINKGNCTYVHCSQGISRSTTLVLYYLINKCDMTLNEAFQKLKQKRNRICPSVGFVKGLIYYEEKILAKKPSFSIEEYSINCIKEIFHDLDCLLIEESYKNAEEKVNLEDYVKNLKKKVFNEDIEPIGYTAIDLLLEKHKDSLKKRLGCTLHHPFDKNNFKNNKNIINFI